MRIFPRISRPTLRPLRQRLRKLQQRLTVARVVVLLEWLLFAGAMTFALTGQRARALDQMGRRADVLIVAALLVLFAVLHLLVRRYVVPALERYFSPVQYDERRILFDLGQEARVASDLNHLFRLIVRQIGEALRAEDVSIFVRDETSGDYLCRVSSSHNFASDDEAEEEAARARASLLLAREAFVVRRLRSLALPLEIGVEDFEKWERAFAGASAAQRATRRKERETLTELKSRLLMPIRSKEQLVGILSLGQCRVRHEYDTADKEMLMSVGSQLALVIENSRLTERMLADERLRRELALAAEVQRRLLPAQAPECLTVELAGFCQPARGVGGDYYDFFTFDNQQLGIAIADVAGKGIAAALLMSTVQATLRSLSAGNTSPNHSNDSLANMVATLNRLLCNSTGGANYVTFFYAQYDQDTQQLAYVNAGHNPPFVFRANHASDFRKLDAGGMFVGMFEHCSYEQEIVQMQRGDVLIAFTDGLSEAMSAQGEEFDDARIREALAATAHLPINDIRDEIVRRVKVWCAGAPQHDDLTFLVLKVK